MIKKIQYLVHCFLFIIGNICVVLLFSSCTEKKNEITIGALLPLTGDNSSYGMDCRRGMELAVDEYNTKHTIKVKLLFEDTKADPKTAVSSIIKLISTKNIKILVGDMFSNTTMAIAPIAQKNGIVLITPTAALESIPAIGDGIFTIYPTSKFEGQFVASFALKRGLHKFGIFKQNVQVAEDIGNAFASKIKEMKGQIIFSEIIPSGLNDYRSILEKNRKNVIDAIFVSAYRDEAGNIIRQAREMGYKNLFLSQSTLYDEQTLKLFGSAVDGVVFSAPYFNDQMESKKLTSFRASYLQKCKVKPSIWAAYGYDVVKMSLQALDTTGTNKQPLKTVISQMKYDGVTGYMTFSPNRTIQKNMQMMQVNNNTFTILNK